MSDIIKLTEDMQTRAWDFARDSTESTWEYKGFDQGKAKRNRIYYGKLGEEGVCYYLNSHGNFNCKIDYEIYHNIAKGDDYDFRIKGKTIDVKTGEKAYYKQLLIVKEIFDKIRKADFYIGANLDKDNLIIHGFAYRKDVYNANIGKANPNIPVYNYSIKYTDLHPMKELIDILKVPG